MNLTFTPSGWDDYQWFQQHDRKLLKRINLLIQDEHRLVYSAKANDVIVIACRYHYGN
jgi:toxin YoeB